MNSRAARSSLTTSVLDSLQLRSSYLFPLLIILAGSGASFTIIKWGPPGGHSIGLNVIWLDAFSRQLLSGDLYPRWLVDLNEGTGSPVFFFYGPLPFYLASICAWLFGSTSPTMIQLAIAESLFVTASGLSFYLLARKHVPIGQATAAALLYMWLPYHF